MKSKRQNNSATSLYLNHGASQAQTLLSHGLGMHQRGLLTQAASCYEEVLRIQPRNFDALHLLGAIAAQTNDFPLSVKLISQAIEINPTIALAHYNLGVALNNLKEHQAALESCSRAIRIQPDYAEAYYVRGNALKDLDQMQMAIENYEKAIQLQPNYAEAHNNRGAALKEIRRYQAALESCSRAIRLKPDFAEAYNNRGNALKELGQLQAAIEDYNRAIQLKSDYVEAYTNSGNALSELKQYQSAIERYGIAIQLNPGADYLHGQHLYTKLKICDWQDFELEINKIENKINCGEKASTGFITLGIFDSPKLHMKAADIWLQDNYPENALSATLPQRQEKERIRIGYYSADFRNHPVSQVMAEVFESHDKSKFEIIGFSSSFANDEMTQRVSATFDKFIDTHEMSDQDVAQLSRDLEIDIAIDLGGFTAGCRPGIFSSRAAPIQVNFLGYPGTMTAKYIDYIIADSIIISPADHEFYSEQVICLPESFFPGDSKRLISDKVFTRLDFGLPQSGFVFCCFNENHKITPKTFDIWMRILQQVEGSVLWLSFTEETAAINLRNEASQRGINPARLVFSQRVPDKAEHLARHRLADLFLDTFPYNAHTTANDALWAGLPVLTCKGQSFASRVAASQLCAVGLAELVTATKEEYEQLAVEIAKNPQQLARIKSKLKNDRLTSHLFDTRSYTKHLECAYTSIVKRHHLGLPPVHINIEAQTQPEI